MREIWRTDLASLSVGLPRSISAGSPHDPRLLRVLRWRRPTCGIGCRRRAAVSFYRSNLIPGRKGGVKRRCRRTILAGARAPTRWGPPALELGVPGEKGGVFTASLLPGLPLKSRHRTASLVSWARRDRPFLDQEPPEPPEPRSPETRSTGRRHWQSHFHSAPELPAGRRRPRTFVEALSRPPAGRS